MEKISIEEASMKQCSDCKETKPLSMFSKHKGKKDGLRCYCKTCAREQCRKYYQANPEYSRKWYQENKEKRNEYQRKWRQENAEKNKEYFRKYYQENAKKVREKNRQWSQNNPEKINAFTAKRRASKLQRTPHWSNLEDIKMWYEVAEVLSRSGVKFHVDHVVPLQGHIVSGLHVSDNLTVIPAYLNCSKNNSWSWDNQK